VEYKESITFIAGVAATLFWIGYVAPGIARFLGIPAAIGFRRADRKNQHLSRAQYFWLIGVLGFGFGLFLWPTIDEYLRWKLLGDEIAKLQLNYLFRKLVIYLVGGALFGFWTFVGRPTAPKSDLKSGC
jgi:Na+-driven multidrug efflux pump